MTPRPERFAAAGIHKPLHRETLDSQIYRALRTAILEQEFSGGERLTQEELARTFGTSRIPVRDALKRLAGDGLVSVDDSGSYRVVTFGPEDVREVYAIRALVEPYAARLGARALTPEGLSALVDLNASMVAAADEQDFEGYTRFNASFHLSLYEASEMPRLVRIIETLWVGRPPLTPIQVPGQVARSLEEHEQILVALRKGDPDQVAMWVQHHIEHARDALLLYYSRQGAANHT